MSKPQRLFLFAAYNKDCVIDDSLIYYIAALSKFGDIIVYADCDCPESEINKLKKYTVQTIAKRHGEYDFGSYKRAFQYARDKDMLKKYDFVYLVNDSVFGPFYDMNNIIQNTEKIKSDAAGLVVATHKTHSYMESWFVRLNKKIFMSKWFDEFISSVTIQPSKSRVTIKYEHGLSNLIHEHGMSWDGLFIYHGRFTYNNPKSLFKHGCPFVKKASFTRHCGTLGNEIKYVLNHCDNTARDAVINSCDKLYGAKYMNWLLTDNPLKIFIRKIKYLLIKMDK